MKPLRLYDPKCEDLARFFLPYDASLETIQELAADLQDAAEDFLQERGL